MKISDQLSNFLHKHGILPPLSERDLGRSVSTQVKNLSDFYTGKTDVSPWLNAGRLPQLRQAYLRHYLPLGLVRAGAVWEELKRLGWTPRTSAPLRAIDLGAGPGSTAFGISAVETHPVDWVWVDRDLSLMEVGAQLLPKSADPQRPPILRKADLAELLKRPKSDRYDLWTANVSLRELGIPPKELAPLLLAHWQRSLEAEGLAILIEAGSRDASRWLLELRRELLAQQSGRKSPLVLLTPCLGTQTCGALENPKDWCHETVTWNRSLEFRKLDQMTGMDHRTIDFSYLVFARSERPREALLPAAIPPCQRVVSPAHEEGRDLEFWICGSQGKCKARTRNSGPSSDIERGSVLVDTLTEKTRSYVRILETEVT